MIYLIYGNDNKEKNIKTKDLAKSASIVRVPADQITQNALLNFSSQTQLFGEAPIVVVENALSEEDNIFNPELLDKLKDSTNIFVFLEDNLTQAFIKKYKKYLQEIFYFEKKEISKSKINAFVVADMFARRDKVGAWTSYLDLIENGEAPEAISGMLFWKIKTMISSNINKPYSSLELIQASSNLVDIYHKGHSGELDMKVALEQFILSTI
jgi:DNA polymerase III delta subunit